MVEVSVTLNLWSVVSEMDWIHPTYDWYPRKYWNCKQSSRKSHEM